jgi:hypothetical protein
MSPRVYFWCSRVAYEGLVLRLQTGLLSNRLTDRNRLCYSLRPIQVVSWACCNNYEASVSGGRRSDAVANDQTLATVGLPGTHSISAASARGAGNTPRLAACLWPVRVLEVVVVLAN